MFARLLYKFLAFSIRLVLRVNGGIEVKDMENIPGSGGVIVAANHISYIDPPLLGGIIPRQATFMARKGLFEIPVIRMIMRNFAIPVDRKKTSPSTMKEAVKRLRNGEVVVLFPEGRRSETGDFLEAKRGIGMLVQLGKVPVVPTLIIGTDRVLPVEARWLKRAKITVVFGKPMYYTSIQQGDASPTHEDISRQIMGRIQEMKRTYADNRC